MKLSIGEKIKKRRKELKMTQSKLAGDKISRSMLSQIENDIVTPSMKSLQYIALRLDKPIAYFLEEPFSSEEKQIPHLSLDKILKDLKEIDLVIESNEYYEAIEKLTSILDVYNIPESNKIYAHVCYRIGKCHIKSGEFLQGEEKLKIAKEIYLKNRMFLEASMVCIEYMYKHYDKLSYAKALDVINEAKVMYDKSLSKDNILEIELLYLQSGLLVALDNMEDSVRKLDEAISLSNKTSSYHNSDKLYRMYAAYHLENDDYEKFKFYINKARLFAEFTDNLESLSSIKLSLAIYENKIKNGDKAFVLLEEGKKHLNESLHYAYYIEKSTSYYLQEKYDMAYKTIKDLKYQYHGLHRLDYLYLWSGKVYEGLILNKLGKSKKALAAIKEGINHMERFPNSMYLSFAYQSLSKVYSSMNMYENAFKSLEKANEIDETLKATK